MTESSATSVVDRSRGLAWTRATICAGILLVSAAARPAAAQLVEGPEFNVNTVTAGDQQYPKAATTPAGRFMVVWQSDGVDGGGLSGGSTGVCGRLYDMTGIAQTGEFLLNSYTLGSQDDPDVAWDGVSRFVVVWKSVNQDGDANGVFGQRFSNTGAPVGTEFRANTFTANSQSAPAVAGDGSGGFIVVWESFGQDGDNLGVFGQRYASSGAKVGTEFRANTFTTGSQGEAAVAADAAGNFTVAWRSVNQDGSGGGVYCQRYAATGTKVGTEFRANTETLGGQDTPSVAMDAAGNLVVAWESNGQDGSAKGVYAQRYSSAGAKVGTEFRVNTFTPLTQDDVDVVMDPLGNFIIAWESAEQDGDPIGTGVFAQRYTSAGAPLGTEFQVNTFTSYGQEDPAIAIDDAGNFVVAWSSYLQDVSGEGIFAKIFSETGVVTTTTMASGSTTTTTTTTVSTTTTTLAVSEYCAATPAIGCIGATPGKSSILIKKKDGDKDIFKWKLGKGGQTALADFKDPAGNPTATYRVCVYDAAQKRMELDVPPMGTCAGKPCWAASGSNGYKYANRDATPKGVISAKLKSGIDGKSLVLVRGKGVNLEAPAPPLEPQITVQLVIDDGSTSTCWQTVFTTTTKNDSARIQAKGP